MSKCLLFRLLLSLSSSPLLHLVLLANDNHSGDFTDHYEENDAVRDNDDDHHVDKENDNGADENV